MSLPGVSSRPGCWYMAIGQWGAAEGVIELEGTTGEF